MSSLLCYSKGVTLLSVCAVFKSKLWHIWTISYTCYPKSFTSFKLYCQHSHNCSFLSLFITWTGYKSKLISETMTGCIQPSIHPESNNFLLFPSWTRSISKSLFAFLGRNWTHFFLRKLETKQWGIPECGMLPCISAIAHVAWKTST